MAKTLSSAPKKALAALSPEFGAWMHWDATADGARRDILSGRFTDANKEALFRAAHDIKGMYARFTVNTHIPTRRSLPPR